MSQTDVNNDRNHDPRALLLLAFACLTAAAVLPPERVKSFTDLFTLVLTVTGRR